MDSGADFLTTVAGLGAPLCVFAVRERVTSGGSQVRQAVSGVTSKPDGTLVVLRDWEILKLLNDLSPSTKTGPAPTEFGEVRSFVEHAQHVMEHAISGLRLDFAAPDVEAIGVLYPGADRKNADGAA